MSLKISSPPQEGHAAAPLAVLSTVTLTRIVHAGGRPLPQGTAGTVVAAYKDGLAYEVEFEQPFHAVVTLRADDLSA
jgi:hypothetical protein